MTWLIKGKPVDTSDVDNVNSGNVLLPGDIVEASVSIQRLKAPHSGDWTCIVASQDDPVATLPIKTSWTTPFQKSVNILVITSETKLCTPHVTYTSRGTFRWGVAVGGHTVQQACPSTRQQRGFGFAYFLCKQTGDWAPSVNASQCAYTR